MGWVRLGMLGMILFIMKFLNENPYKTTLVSTIILSLSEEKKNHLKLYVHSFESIFSVIKLLT